jgi:hypothetical protein
MNTQMDKTIDEYYSSIDKSILNNLCQNNNLKNLINLSTVTDLYIFNKKNKKWKLKSKDKLLKECETIKKKEIKTTSNMLANLAKLNNNYETTNIKHICENLNNKITNIDNVIKCIELLDTNTENNYDSFNFNEKIKIIDIVKSPEIYDNYIEYYTNC